MEFSIFMTTCKICKNNNAKYAKYGYRTLICKICTAHLTWAFRSRLELAQPRCIHQGSARAAQNIKGNHKPIFTSNFHSMNTNSPSKKLATH